jgi:hypothetical protein
MIRTLGMYIAALALATFVGAAAVHAADEKANTHSGTFVKAEKASFVMKDKEGKEHTHLIADNLKVTIDGKDSTLRDLKAGDPIKVTVENNKAVRVEKERPKTVK